MDVDSIWATLATLLGALLVYLIVGVAEAALATISRTRLRLLSEEGRSGADSGLHLLEDPDRLRESVSLLRLILVVVIVAAAVLIAQGIGGSVVVTLVGAWAGVMLLQALAGAIGMHWYHSLAPTLAPLMIVLALFVAPLRVVLGWFQRRFAGAPVEDEETLRLSEEERRVLASVVGDEEAIIPEEGREMIHSIVTLGQTTVREVMVPRPDLVALRSDCSLVDALDTVIKEGHSRVPVYEENVDNIIGILYAKDLLGYFKDGRTDVPIRDMLRPALFVPSSRMADELLQDLQRRRVHLAVVFDEYGGTAGLVTIEDILEEIVGEIQDEYDEEEEAFYQINEYEAMVSGRLDIDDLNHEMGLNLPTDENDTVGGLIYSALGRVPLLHDEVRMEEAGVTFRVVGMAGRRILKVHILVDRPPSDEAQDEPLEGEARTDTPSSSGAEVGASHLLFF
ncbi:MAG: hemolysin family protein [Chloroflexota bacterium]|nr:hemolysin family protein [Chloroflexota bacterium]